MYHLCNVSTLASSVFPGKFLYGNQDRQQPCALSIRDILTTAKVNDEPFDECTRLAHARKTILCRTYLAWLWPGRGFITLDHRRAWCLKQNEAGVGRVVCMYVPIYGPQNANVHGPMYAWAQEGLCMYVYEPQKAYVRPRRLMYICVYIYVCLGPRRLMYVCVCMYVCMYVCMCVYVRLYVSQPVVAIPSWRIP